MSFGSARVNGATIPYVAPPPLGIDSGNLFDNFNGRTVGEALDATGWGTNSSATGGAYTDQTAHPGDNVLYVPNSGNQTYLSVADGIGKMRIVLGDGNRPDLQNILGFQPWALDLYGTPYAQTQPPPPVSVEFRFRLSLIPSIFNTPFGRGAWTLAFIWDVTGGITFEVDVSDQQPDSEWAGTNRGGYVTVYGSSYGGTAAQGYYVPKTDWVAGSWYRVRVDCANDPGRVVMKIAKDDAPLTTIIDVPGPTGGGFRDAGENSLSIGAEDGQRAAWGLDGATLNEVTSPLTEVLELDYITWTPFVLPTAP